MPIKSTINKQLRLVVGVAWGRVTFLDIIDHQGRLLSDPDFDPTFNQYMNGSEITEWCVSIDEAEIAASRKLFSVSSKRAFLGPLPVSPLGKIFQAFFELTKQASKIRTFADPPSALKWLDV